MAYEAKTGVEEWLAHISQYDRAFKKWESRVEKITKRYRDEKRANLEQCASFNILWSNVQTLSAATFARLPKPDVSRKFKDNDPTGRVSSLILERDLDSEIQNRPDYRETLKACVQDRFLGGRGTAWCRYDAVTVPQIQITDDVSEDQGEPAERLDYECAPVDYVHYKDFGHSVARNWSEVTRVWRRVYMSMDAKIERFGEDLAEQIPQDAKKKENRDQTEQDADDGSWIYEGWNKETKTACWFHKGMDEYLDELPDPLGLEQFFPCPKPLYATLTNDTLVPVPDFTLYQDQARELDTLSDSIDAMIDALKIRGVYDASSKELARIFTEGRNAALIPIKNWAAFAEKQGLKGSIDLIDLKPIADTLTACYMAAENIKAQVYEITGVSDIIRGKSDPNETATAQQIKGNLASLRLKSYQDEVAQFAAEIISIKAQIICNKFNPQTILQLAAADQLSDTDKQHIPAAMQLLIGPRSQVQMDGTYPEVPTPNPTRSYRIEITADSLINLDERAEQEARTQFLQAVGEFMAKAVQLLLQAGPYAAALAPAICEMLKFGVTAHKVGKGMEGILDETAEQIKKVAAMVAQQAMQPPKPTPQDQADMAKAQASLQETQIEGQIAPIRAQAEMVKAQAEVKKAQASNVDAQLSLQETALRAANPAAFQKQPAGAM